MGGGEGSGEAAVTIDQAIVGAGLAVVAYFIRKVLRDLIGLSRKINKVIAFLIRSEDLNPEQRREQLTAIIEGK
jgi:hypothetical protein